MAVPWVFGRARCEGAKIAPEPIYVEAWEKGNIGNALPKTERKPLKPSSSYIL